MSGPSGQPPPVNMGLQLFPPPPKKAKNPTRKPSTRRNALNPESVVERSESPSFPAESGRQSAMGGRQTPQSMFASPINQSSQQGQSALGGRQTPQSIFTSPITQPSQAHIAAEIPRSHTSFSEAPTLVRSNSNASHNSIAKTGFNTSPQREEPVMRSIFPRYNPELPLEHQPYFPTQTSPTHIPKTIINRRPYSPSIHDRSPAGLQSPMAGGATPGRFPHGVQDETILEPSSTDELKELWKVANGWRVSASEGRSFCLKMTSAPEEPVHTLSSATQPFYTMRLIPTSTSAQLSVVRHDPSKPVSSSPKISLSSSSKSKDKETTTEVLSTTLEEAARRLPPNDGLVALLYPKAAANMAIDMATKHNRADSESVIAAAERECGRLVWDNDSGKYYLCHPSMANPFVISISSSPAWSRVEYVLEHPELSRNLVRLVRDGAGMGFLEVDTSVASKVDAFYIVDVAICAVLLVAVEEEKSRRVEFFDAPPPSIAPDSPRSPGSIKGKGKRGLSTSSPKSKSQSKKDRRDSKLPRMEEFEMDIESQSQDSMYKGLKKGQKEKEEKVPGFCGLIWMLIKCFVWGFWLIFKGLGKCIVLLGRCCISKKK